MKKTSLLNKRKLFHLKEQIPEIPEQPEIVGSLDKASGNVPHVVTGVEEGQGIKDYQLPQQPKASEPESTSLPTDMPEQRFQSEGAIAVRLHCGHAVSSSSYEPASKWKEDRRNYENQHPHYMNYDGPLHVYEAELRKRKLFGNGGLSVPPVDPLEDF